MQMMEMLMDRGSAVDAGNKGGWTALHRAALTGRVPACRLLLRRGAGLNSITKDGRTALHLAALQVCSAGREDTQLLQQQLKLITAEAAAGMIILKSLTCC